MSPAELQHEIETLYADYAEILDSGRLERWPELFVDPCLYRLVSAENYDRGLPISLMRCESVGMLKDRAFACEKLNVSAPRAWRHVIAQIRFDVEAEGDETAVRANFAVFETLADQPTQVLLAGRYIDTLARTAQGLRFRNKISVYDTNLIPGSIVRPV
jgi:3-phenylpropionate/cinnamic acid dioxygenase small subunit